MPRLGQLCVSTLVLGRLTDVEQNLQEGVENAFREHHLEDFQGLSPATFHED
jgi:hypothetical protein